MSFLEKSWIRFFEKSIKQIDVINAFRKINNEYGIKGVSIQNENDSQFITNNVKQTLFAHRIWYNTRRFHTAIKMTPDPKWEQNIHTTAQKRGERNLAENLNPETNNYHITVSMNVSK